MLQFLEVFQGLYLVIVLNRITYPKINQGWIRGMKYKSCAKKNTSKNIKKIDIQYTSKYAKISYSSDNNIEFI